MNTIVSLWVVSHVWVKPLQLIKLSFAFCCKFPSACMSYCVLHAAVILNFSAIVRMAGLSFSFLQQFTLHGMHTLTFCIHFSLLITVFITFNNLSTLFLLSWCVSIFTAGPLSSIKCVIFNAFLCIQQPLFSFIIFITL